MKDSVQNFYLDGEYLSLTKISQTTSFGVDYLVSVAKSGKLKSFKVGDQWYSSQAWLDDFRIELRTRLEEEAPSSREARWTDYLSRPENKTKRFNYFFLFLVSIFIYSWLILLLFLSFQLFSVSSYCRLGQQFIDITNQFYGWPIRSLGSNQALMSDELITQEWQKLGGFNYSYDGQVAGESENSSGLLK